LEEEGDRLYLDQGTFRMDVTKYGKTIKEGASSSELTLGIRPEYIIISDKPLTNSAKSQVYVTEPLGFRTVIDFKVGKDTIVKVIGEAGVSCKLGDVKWIIFPTDKIHVIDKKTEKVLV